MKIAEFEKSELSIRLADKMDKMERIWEMLSNRSIKPHLVCFKGFLIQKVEDVSERLRNAHFLTRFLVRIVCKTFYALIFAAIAYYLTRDTQDYYAEHNKLSSKQTDMEPPIYYKWAQFLIVWGVLLL